MDRNFHHNLLPNLHFIQEPGLYDKFAPVMFQSNSFGMRGPKMSPKADVLIIGDSFVEARTTDWEKTVGPKLQESLGHLQPQPSVASHGVSSWSPLLEWNWYLKVGHLFSPRVVFLFVFWNDFLMPSEDELTDSAYVRQVMWNSQGRPDYFLLPQPRSLRQRLENLQTVRLMRHAARQFRERIPGWQIQRRWELAVATQQTLPNSSNTKELDDTTPPYILLDEDQMDTILSLPEDLLEERLNLLKIHEGLVRGFWAVQRPLSLWSDQRMEVLAASEEFMGRFATDVESDGGKLVVVYVPHPWQVGADENSLGRVRFHVGKGAILPMRSGVQEWLTLVTKRLHVDMIDPTTLMRQVKDKGPFVSDLL
jgi:hypothetical protein